MKKFGLTTYNIDETKSIPVLNFLSASDCDRTNFHVCARALAERLGFKSNQLFEMWGRPEFTTSGEGSILSAAIQHAPLLVAHVAINLLIPTTFHCTIVTTNQKQAGPPNVLVESWRHDKSTNAVLGQPAQCRMPHDGQVLNWAALLPMTNEDDVVVFNAIISSTSTLQLDSVSRLVGVSSQLPLRPAVTALCECMYIAVSGGDSAPAGLGSETANLQAKTKALFGSLGADVDAETSTAADVFKGQATLMYVVANDRRFKMFGCVLMMMMIILIVHDYICTTTAETEGFFRLRSAIEGSIGDKAKKGREHFLANCVAASEMATDGCNPIQNVPIRHFELAISESTRYLGRGEFMRWLLQTRTFLGALREYNDKVQTVMQRRPGTSIGKENAEDEGAGDNYTYLALAKQEIFDAGQHVIAAAFIHLEPALEYERNGSTKASKAQVWKALEHSGKVAIRSGTSQISCDLCHTPIDDEEARISSPLGLATGSSTKAHDLCQPCYDKVCQALSESNGVAESLLCQEHSTYAHTITNSSDGGVANNNDNVDEVGVTATSAVATTSNTLPASKNGKKGRKKHRVNANTNRTGARADSATRKGGVKTKPDGGDKKEKKKRKRQKTSSTGEAGQTPTSKRRKVPECKYNRCRRECEEFAQCVCCERIICSDADKFAIADNELYICNDSTTKCDLVIQGFHYHSLSSSTPDLLVSVQTSDKSFECVLPEPDTTIFDKGAHDAEKVGTKVCKAIQCGIKEIYSVNLAHQKRKDPNVDSTKNLKRLKHTVMIAGLENELIKTTNRLDQLKDAIAEIKSRVGACGDNEG